jgi:hypothetical protein
VAILPKVRLCLSLSGHLGRGACAHAPHDIITMANGKFSIQKGMYFLRGLSESYK